MTHGSIIRAVGDYIWKALDYRGKIVVADSPLTSARFDSIIELAGVKEIASLYTSKGLDFQTIDLRKQEWQTKGEVITSRRSLPGDPSGYIAYDLGDASEFSGHRGVGLYHGADYDAEEVNSHHNGIRNEYLISASVIRSDVIFSLPKMKTHMKAGVTVSLKNLVGVNGDKNWLPHHTEGDHASGGDERPVLDHQSRLERVGLRVLSNLTLKLPRIGAWLHIGGKCLGKRIFGSSGSVIRNGNWFGNDTIWRTCLDPQ